MENQQKLLGLITRCKDEFFIKEFCDYYLSQGVEHIYVIDDNSNDKSIYKYLENNDKITILYEKKLFNGHQMNHVNELYKNIKNDYKWIISVDVDEFITTKKNANNTIRDELETTFQDVDCIKVPWVMMSCNNRENNPKSILLENTYRWNHDLKHPHINNIRKFRCRYNQIEVKCIFKTQMFDKIDIHHPYKNNNNYKVVDSINLKNQKLDPYYNNLRENDIKNGYLLCYHYRIISRENSQNKLNKAQYLNFTINDLMSSDYPEIFDDTIKNKYKDIKSNKKIFIIGFNKTATRSLHNFFLNNGLKSIHWDNNNLVKIFENNIKNNNKLLTNGKTINKSVNSDCNYEDAIVFSDMTNASLNKDAKDYYQLLDSDYPNSKFILNIRDVNKWIKSRINHPGFLKKQMNYHKCSKEEIIIIWRNMYEKYILEVMEYFKDRNNDLCIFDIENDSIEKIISFLNKYSLNKEYYKKIR